jgi:ATP-dependent Lon protease
MTTALLSLLRQEKVQEDLGMTGEITLTGKVLPVGGIKEKLIAARRSKLKTLIFPKANFKDFDELPHYIKEGINVYFVENFEEVFTIAFKNKSRITSPKSLKKV